MRIRFWLAAAAVSFAAPQAASAEEAVAAAVRGWIAAIDATPQWAASYDALYYDAPSDTARVSNLFIRPETAPAAGGRTSLSLGTLSVSGYVEGPEGFKVGAIAADGGVIEAGAMTMHLDDIALAALAAPYGLAFDYDPAKPISSIVAVYRGLLDVDLREGRIGSVTIDQDHDGVNSRIVYTDFVVEGMADGRVARFDTGAVRMESPAPEGLVKMTVGSIESEDTDLGAFVHAYDPAAYADGVGDMTWRDAMASAAYNDVVVELPGAQISYGSIRLEGVRVRQPPESFLGYFDDMFARPNMPDALQERIALQMLPAMLSSVAVGRFAIEDISVAAMGIDHLTLGDIHFDDLSVDGLGEFAIEDLASVVQGQGAIEMQRFALGKISFGGYDALKRLIGAATTGTASGGMSQADRDELIPKLGFLELLGLELQTPDIPRLSLARFRTDLADYVGLVPTEASLAVDGLSLPVNAITDPGGRDMLRKLGYDRIVSTFGFAAAYDPAGQRLTLDDLHYGIDQMGTFRMDGVLADLPIEALRDEVLFQAAAPTLLLERASFTFKDDSIVGKGLDLLAGYMNAPPGAFRDQFADAMPFLLSVAVQNDPKLLAIVNRSGLFKQLTPVVRDFVANPGSSITVSLAPPTPITLEAIGTALESAPQTVAERLGISITGEKGSLTAPPAPGGPETPPAGPGGTTPSVEPTGPGGSGGGGKVPATPKPGAPAGGTDAGGDGAGTGGSTPASRTGSE